jgi:hypothetical protein
MDTLSETCGLGTPTTDLIMPDSTAEIQEETLKNDVKLAEPIITESSEEKVELMRDAEEDTTETKSSETICFILTGVGVTDLRITQKNAGKKELTFFDNDFGWCFQDKEDALKIAEEYSRKGKEIKVSPWLSERAYRKWHGTNLEKKAVRKETKYLIAQRDTNEKKKYIVDACDKAGFDISCLDDNNPPEGCSELEKKTFDFLKKDRFPDWIKDKKLCEEFKKEWEDIEEKIEKDKNEKLTNPNEWPFTVLGYNNKREIILWHQGDLMLIPVKQLSKRDLQLLIGSFGLSEDSEGIIIQEAHKKGKIYDDKPIKSGVWKFKNKWLVVSGKRVAIIDQNKLETLDYPVFEDKIIKFENKNWIDWDHFEGVFGKVTLTEVYNKIHKKVFVWNWASSTMSEYATSFILLSVLQHAMSWRPWINITGAKGTGKSTFFDSIIQGVYSVLVQRLDKSTAHATAQNIGNSSKVPIFDEFEKNKHIPDILEMLKLSNSGGVKTSGTPGEKSLEFDLHHMPWFGSIYLPQQISQDSAQESRLIKLELKKLAEGTPLLEKIEAEEGAKMAAEIVSAMIYHWDEIESGAKYIAKNRKDIMTRVKGVQIRTVDNFMYASSLLNIAIKTKYDVPDWVNVDDEDDGEKIINFILSSLINVEGKTHSLGACITLAIGDQTNEFKKTLENVGIKHTSKDGVKYIALRTPNIVRFLLKDTDYKNMDIQAPLSRIEGAISTHPVKFSGKQERCVLVPLSFINGEI